MTVHWKNEKIYTNSRTYFQDIASACDSARYSIDMEYYIFHTDDAGKLLHGALLRAVERGVTVRLLVDGFGSAEWIYRHARELFDKGIEVRIFHPIPFYLLPGFFRFFFLWFRWLPYLVRVNRRNHRKICLLDRRTAFVGSQNVFFSYGHQAISSPWRETGVKVEGVAVSEIAIANERAWKRSWSFGRKFLPVPRFLHRRSKDMDSGLVRLNDTPMKRRALWRDLRERISQAKSRIWITNAYFIPSGWLLKALSRAARKGVDVRILLPSVSDIAFLPWVSAALYSGLMKAGVKIFEYRPFVLHAKTMLIDDWSTVGTSNLNYRSLIRDLEIDIVLVERESIQTLENIFLEDVLHSVCITSQDLQNKPWYVRAIGSMALSFKKWL